MKFIISKVSYGFNHNRIYLNKTMIVPDWFCEQTNIPRVIAIELLRQSDKAMLFLIKNKEYWIPKSLIKFIERKEKSLGEF